MPNTTSSHLIHYIYNYISLYLDTRSIFLYLKKKINQGTFTLGFHHLLRTYVPIYLATLTHNYKGGIVSNFPIFVRLSRFEMDLSSNEVYRKIKQDPEIKIVHEISLLIK